MGIKNIGMKQENFNLEINKLGLDLHKFNLLRTKANAVSDDDNTNKDEIDDSDENQEFSDDQDQQVCISKKCLNCNTIFKYFDYNLSPRLSKIFCNNCMQKGIPLFYNDDIPQSKKEKEIFYLKSDSLIDFNRVEKMPKKFVRSNSLLRAQT